VALMGLIYKGENLTTSLFIVIVMLLASLSPITMASSVDNSEISEISYGSLDDFSPSEEGKKIYVY